MFKLAVVAAVRSDVNFDSISAAAVSRDFSAASIASANAAYDALLFLRTLIRQSLQIAKQFEFAPRGERLCGGRLTTHNHAPPR